MEHEIRAGVLAMAFMAIVVMSPEARASDHYALV